MLQRRVIGVLVAVVAIGAGFLFSRIYHAEQTIVLGGNTFQASVMRTADELRRGLSGTPNLPADSAMLFVFPMGSSTTIWMKDMNYPIDIVWLNEDRRIIHIEKNVDPSTYNSTNPERSEIFGPDTPARYVIELPSGTIEKTGVRMGDQATLPSGI